MSKDKDMSQGETPDTPETIDSTEAHEASDAPGAQDATSVSPPPAEPVPPLQYAPPVRYAPTPAPRRPWVVPVAIVIGGLLVLAIGGRVAFGLARGILGHRGFAPGIQRGFAGRGGRFDARGGWRDGTRSQAPQSGCPHGRGWRDGNGSQVPQGAPRDGFPQGRGWRGGGGSTDATVTPQSTAPSY